MTDERTTAAAALLERLPLFSGCTHNEIEQLASSSVPIAFHAGDRMCVAGTDAPECYVLAEGEVRVTVGNVEIATVRPVDVVGERGPINGRPRAATVTATTRVFAYAIGRTQLRELMLTSPTAAATMRDELLRRYG